MKTLLLGKEPTFMEYHPILSDKLSLSSDIPLYTQLVAITQCVTFLF